ncbi:Glucosyltransferase-like protein [Puccinia graminis f. sp. tritici]|uniref:Glucosyltransferase-like protein n=1 Tax=Puccinia graminis f. sp. tritici TaxID=56615 RepID=A0A5B0PNG1_PUCGR|nr:Glucosyltransferase-like protein [Puccinia graminis f. sp. tritici]KAA1101519.1 Glucosyltransferase-like protein [Puccinia graminis f. sp. tritici]KAA1119888.1 Glucosyltransferase-like protein [Puccinia graminis f. sp. tritici]
MLKVGPLPQRMLKEPAGSGNQASSQVMISLPSGKKLMNRIKNQQEPLACRGIQVHQPFLFLISQSP